MKKQPSIAQIKQRHKFMLTGTLASMTSRLKQLLRDNMIIDKAFKSNIADTLYHLYLAQNRLKGIELYMEDE